MVICSSALPMNTKDLKILAANATTKTKTKMRTLPHLTRHATHHNHSRDLLLWPRLISQVTPAFNT